MVWLSSKIQSVISWPQGVTQEAERSKYLIPNCRIKESWNIFEEVTIDNHSIGLHTSAMADTKNTWSYFLGSTYVFSVDLVFMEELNLMLEISDF